VAGQESPAGGVVAATVEAGGKAVLLAHVRNQSGIVDNYTLRVEGLPEGWWTISPATVYLVPFGSAAEGYEQEVEIALHPPRSSEAEARSWPIEVVADSAAQGPEVGSASATLDIAPFVELESELRPEKSSGRVTGKHALAIRNRGNAPSEIALSGLDPESRLVFRFKHARLAAEPGRRVGTEFRVFPPKQIIVGRPVDRRFELTAQVVGSEAAAPPRQGTLRQQPWLPWWLLAAIPVVIGVAALVWSLLPNTTTVPDLTAARNVFQAQTLLADSKLELGDVTEERTGRVRAGTILAQAPAAGEKVDKGETVDIQVAVSTGKARVPQIVGLTLARADGALRKAGFQLGQVRPEPADPQQDRIVSQIPARGTLTDKGAPVDVFFEVVEEPATTAETIVAPTETAATEPTTTGEQTTTEQTTTEQTTTEETTTEQVETEAPIESILAVPALVGGTIDDAVDALADLELVPVTIRQFSSAVPAGGLIEQTPAAGEEVERGSKVTLVISAGFPRIVYDRRGDLLVTAGGTGRRLEPLAASDEIEEEPAWSPGGGLIAYRRGRSDADGRIWLVSVGRPATARPLTNAGFNDGRPAFSPDGKVVAFIRGLPDGDTNLCFQRAGSPRRPPSCIVDPDRQVSRPAWSPDGHSILVTASDTAEEQAELELYTSRRASSPRKADWVSQGLVTDRLHGKRKGDVVVSAAWSPDGKRVAFTANWSESFVHLNISAVKGAGLGKPVAVPRVRACEITWRLDGEELAVVRRDATCNQPGEIVRVDPDRPEEQVSLTKTGASNPAWEPLRLGG
jgi:beta-lactam-binding protein with PASTA domain